MPTVVQVISIDYGKGGRGSDGARRRAQLPTVLPVPDQDGDALHTVAVVATVEVGARLVIERGWGQLRTNLRVETFDASWYRDVIVNIGRGAGRVTGNWFAGAPTIVRDLRRPIERRRKHSRA